jgi:predicted P-loop ATPase
MHGNRWTKKAKNKIIMSIALTHDGAIEIATGKHRRDKSWKNKKIKWSDLVVKLSKTHRTHETHDEYMAAPKSRQDDIKDIGGFVGGYLQGGRRKKGHALNRQLLTLDIDHTRKPLWDKFKLLYGCAACVYSTHKHTAEAPRERLVIPLSRPVNRDEYVAIGRRVAGTIGIEAFDTTTYQPERLMYWPSTSKDGKYDFSYQDGEWLDADEVLASYTDWTDSSEWPVSDRETKMVKRGMSKQGDPLEKPGLIGAFCRTYDIHDVIEQHLSEVYERTDDENRYTYVEGSTAAGLIVYDDIFAYSHHGTDPISGKLCNAFDLVRLHKFGLQDEDADEDTPSVKLPSFTAMQDYAAKDPKVRKQLNRDRIEEAMSDFTVIGEVDIKVNGEDLSEEDLLGPEPEADDEWLAQLDTDRKGTLRPTINNVARILENDPLLKGRFSYDEFTGRKIVRALPWRQVTQANNMLIDEDEQNLVKYLEKVYDISVRTNIKDAFDTHVRSCAYHPIRDYLNAQTWDGTDRLETVLIDYLGAEDTDYVRAVTSTTFVAAVARVFDPGCKFDNVLTLIGPQGIGKSTLLSKMGRQWFSDSFNFNMLHSKEAYEQINGSWIIEIGEMTGMRKADVEAAKQFISKREDTYRVAYGRNTTTFKRQCVLIGSTNNEDFLRDATGNRRFWPVRLGVQKARYSVFKDLDAAMVGQLWAEAVEYYKKGHKLHLSAAMEKVANEVQAQHVEVDGRAGIIARYLEMKLPEDWYEKDVYARRAWLAGDELQEAGTEERKKVCCAEIWCEALGGNYKEFDTAKGREISQILMGLNGWKRHEAKMRFSIYGVQIGYVKA